LDLAVATVKQRYWFSSRINKVKQLPSTINQEMAFPSGFSTTLSNPIGIRLVLFGLAQYQFNYFRFLYRKYTSVPMQIAK